MKLASIPNYHRYVYAFFAALLVVLGMIQTGVIPLPKAYATDSVLFGIACLVAFLTAFLPNFGSTTGAPRLPTATPAPPPVRVVPPSPPAA